MLILTRRPAETIYIGEEVTVTVLGVVGNQVRFGIDAPRNIVIDRAEIHERKKRAAQLANGNPTPEDESLAEPNGNVDRHARSSADVLRAGSDEPNGNVRAAPPEVNGNVALKRR